MLTNPQAAPVLVSGTLPPEQPYDADIIILMINRLPETLEAVKSASNQKNITAQIIVLDQGSSAENLHKFIEQTKELVNISVFTSDWNRGVGGGRNFLSSIGKGGIIIALDNDAVFANEYVVFQAVNLFMKQERLGAVGFHILSVNGQFLDHASWGYPAALKHLSDSKFETTTFVGAGYAVRRDAWVDAGGYDSNLFFTWEEYDFCLRAIERGWNILYDGTLKILHKNSGEERVKWTAERARYFVRNRLMIARKWRVNWLCLLPRISGYIINGAVNGHLGATMEGIFQALHQDRQFHKKHMTPEMRRYIARNEQRHRGSWAARVHSEVLKARSFEVHTVAHAENVNRPRKQS